MAWRIFENATQMPSETIIQWARRINEMELAVKSHNTVVPYEHYIEQWLTGTRESSFLTELRKATNPKLPGVPPTVYDRITFDNFKTAQIAGYDRIRSQRERHRELLQRNGRAQNLTNTRFPKRSPQREGGKPKFSKSNSGNLNRDGPGYNKTRNPHSPLTRRLELTV